LSTWYAARGNGSGYNPRMDDAKDEARRAAMAALLDGLVPGDAAETRDRDAVRALLAGAEDPFARESFAPGHLTASAFVTCGDALLLIWHTKLERWLQPGGHVDPDDADLQAAATRELHEEAGIADARCRGLLDVDVHRIPANPKRGEPAHLHHDVRFWFEVDDRAVTAGSDAGDARWVNLTEMTAALTDASVMRAVAKLR